jgi:hypothetical protein
VRLPSRYSPFADEANLQDKIARVGKLIIGREIDTKGLLEVEARLAGFGLYRPSARGPRIALRSALARPTLKRAAIVAG